jgi:sugar-specific transcriptional regulator TrmB
LDNQEANQVLMKLGLTLNQARILLALDQYNKLTVKEISNISKVAREAVYRIIPELQNLGLVERELGNPNKFLAINLDVAVKTLLNRRQQETNYLIKKSQELLIIKEKLNKDKTSGFESHITLLANDEMVLRKVEQSIKALKKNYLIIAPMNRHQRAIFEFGKILDEALLRGVMIRNVVEKSEGYTKIPKIVREFHLHPWAKIRYYGSGSQTTLLIFDEKEVIILLGKTSEFAGSPALMTNNKLLVSLACEYFNLLWELSVEPTKAFNGNSVDSSKSLHVHTQVHNTHTPVKV